MGGAPTATSLGAGVARLVNALDPQVVTLGGLAEPLRAAAPEEFAAALADGLMAFRRPAPPPVVPGAFGEDGALYGAAATALDQAISEPGIAAWAAERA
jgi:predicted NBD/HSP70 family sugar kinase